MRAEAPGGTGRQAPGRILTPPHEVGWRCYAADTSAGTSVSEVPASQPAATRAVGIPRTRGSAPLPDRGQCHDATSPGRGGLFWFAPGLRSFRVRRHMTAAPTPLRSFRADQLNVEVFADTAVLSTSVALRVRDLLGAAIAAQGFIRLGLYLQAKGDKKAGARYLQAGLTVADTLFTDAYLDAYIELKMAEVTRFRMATHPVEFDMYYTL